MRAVHEQTSQANRRDSELATGERLAIRTRGHTLTALADATRELYGEQALAEMLERLPPRVGRVLVERPEWVPAEFVVAWYETAWEGPLRRDSHELARLTRRMLELGFGRVRRVLLGIATPAWVLRKGPELWRGEHSGGRFVAYGTEPGTARAALHDHPFLDSAVMREAVAESFRHPIVLAGAKDTTVRHEGAVGESLIVTITWRD